MSLMRTATLLALGVIIGAAAASWFARAATVDASSVVEQTTAAAGADRKIIYYHDPSGAPFWSAEPKKDASGRDYLPIFEDEDISFEPGGKKPVPTAGGPRKIILYYRNPMGLPD